MIRVTYQVKLASQQQLRAIPIGLLAIASESIDDASTGVSLVYLDPLTAFKVASSCGGIVEPRHTITS